MGTYLGIPESLGGSKIQVFGFVQDRLATKLMDGLLSSFPKGGRT